MRNRHCLLACGIAAVLCVLLENWTPLDLAVQQLFYRQGHWIIIKAESPALHLFLYTGAKGFVAFLGASALILTLLTLNTELLKKWRHFLCVLTLAVALVPLIAASLKAVTGVYSPKDLLPFGGTHPYLGMLSHLWQYGVVDGGRSFPAGHAAGGFSLMALYYLPAKKRFRHAGLICGMAAGWGMGLYQMARGEHFFSHTLTTMFLAWGTILCIDYACEYARGRISLLWGKALPEPCLSRALLNLRKSCARRDKLMGG